MSERNHIAMRRHLHRSGASPSRQRGAAAIIIGSVLLTLVTLMALLIETGRLYYAQRDLEKIAAFAALDGARVASGCARDEGVPGDGVPRTLDTAAVEAEVQASIDRNNTTAIPLITPGGNERVELGMTDTTVAAGRRRFVPLADGDSHIDSVRVNLARAQPVLLFPFLGAPDGVLYASSAARQAAIGTFNIGSNLLNVNGGLLNQLLGGLFCAANDTTCKNSIISLNVADSLTGLAGVNVSLGDLAAAVGVSVQDLSNPLVLEATTPLLNTLLSGLAAQLGGSISSNVSTLLQNLAAASSNPNGVPFGQLLGAVDNVAASVPFVNLLDLILALGESASANDDGSIKPIALPLGFSLLGVTGNTYLRILESPRFGMGRAGTAQASTAQAEIQVRIQVGGLVNRLLGFVAGLVLTNQSTIENIGIDVALATGSVDLDRLQCPIAGVNGGFPVAGLSARTGIVGVNIGTFSGAPDSGAAVSSLDNINLLSGHLSPLGGLLGSADLAIALVPTAVGISSGEGPLNDVTQWTVATNEDGSLVTPRSYTADGATGIPVADNPQAVPSQAPSITAEVALQTPLITNATGVLRLGSVVINTLLDLVTPLVNNLVTAINGLLLSTIDPLLDALGVSAGNGRVTMTSAEVRQPELISNCLPNSTSPTC